MAVLLALPAAGFIYLDAYSKPLYSVEEVPGGMPVFAPHVVTMALEIFYSNGLEDAAKWHEAKAKELIETQPFIAKVHADSADAIRKIRS